MAEPIPRLLFLLILFFANSIFKVSYSIILCPEIEKEALLSFKQSLEDPSNRLSSWNTSNCCNWKGVVCSNVTGNVHQLHLHHQGDSDYQYSNSRKIHPSLLQLKQLKYLDLSGNFFAETIPSFMGSLTSLEYLNLSGNGFYGKIPRSIGNLSSLHTLSLEDNGGLDVDSLEWLRGLSQLEHLNMNFVNLTKAASHWIQVINALPSLVELHLSSCGLNFIFDPSSDDVNITSLAILDLSKNNFESFPVPKWILRQNYLVFLDLSWSKFRRPLPTSSNTTTNLQHIDLSGNMFESFPIPQWIFELRNLVFLDLSGSDFRGPIPTVSNTTKLRYINLSLNYYLNSTIPDWLYSCKDLEFVSMRYNSLQGSISNAIWNLTSLTTLDLSGNQLSGEIPRGIVNSCKLQRLDLSDNMYQGEISDTFGNMSECFLGSLTYLVLSENQLSGNLTHQFGEFESLQELDFRKNLLTGEIPINLGKLSNLEALWLNDNRFTGNLPISMGELSNLEYLDVGNNMMRGDVTETHFANLSKLRYFSASGNHMALKLSPDWKPPFKVDTLELGSWNLGAGSGIPSWLETQKSTMIELDLSNTGISGNVPSWFWEMRFLNLSHNHLSGNIPDISGPETGPRLIYLTSNQFSGPLPRVGNTVEEINFSNNSFYGGISHFLCDMRNQTYRLVNLDIRGNQLSGEIPDCWMKWPDLTVVNLGDNNFSGTIPSSLGVLKYMLSLNLYDNKLSGQIPVSLSNCTELVKMDLSGNNLVGNIPTWIGTSLSKLRFLILRSNKLSGTIPWSICHLNSLQIVDLSNNALSGRIPSCVNNLTAMTVKRNLSEYISGDLDFSSYYFGNFLESASVTVKGRENHYDTILSLVNTIDLSDNNLSGGIPKELTSLVELISLNLSGNHLTGSIPESIGDMKQLGSLDLSRNGLSGEMPNSFSAMTFLSYLNLSCNNLTGRISESTQLRGMNASSFAGNDLCGPPLPRKCRGDDDNDEEDAGSKEVIQDDKSEIEWFYVLLSLGYAVGLSVFCTTFVLKRSWRRAYFGFVECMWDKLYVYYHINCAKLRRQSTNLLRSWDFLLTSSFMNDA